MAETAKLQSESQAMVVGKAIFNHAQLGEVAVYFDTVAELFERVDAMVEEWWPEVPLYDRTEFEAASRG